jgi:DNA-binding NarL/FixJ family response regulator
MLSPNNTPPDKISVLVVDDHPLIRVGVSALIDARTDMTVVAQAGTGEAAVAHHRELHPDITLMDLRLPGMSGVRAIQEIRKFSPAARFVVVTMYEGDEDVHQALEAGAQGYLIKGMPHETLISAIKRVHTGGRFVPPPVARLLESRTGDSTLSPREREVLALLVRGNSNKEIAQQLFIADATVKAHLRVIFMRLGVTDRTQAVVTAIQRGLVHL